jgi:hypothetical protein
MALRGIEPYLQQMIKELVFAPAVTWEFYARRK